MYDARNADVISKIIEPDQDCKWTMPLRAGDILIIRVDFFRRRMRFYVNNWFCGEVNRDEGINEGVLFPTFTLSSGSQVLIRNVNQQPELREIINLSMLAGKFNLVELEKLPPKELSALLQYLNERFKNQEASPFSLSTIEQFQKKNQQ